MSLYRLAGPLLPSFPPGTVHRTIHDLLTAACGTPTESLLERRYHVDNVRLTMRASGLNFPNLVGVTAGFDKNAEIPTVLSALGFGHVEVGDVTAEPQPENPRPRMFCLPEDEVLISRMGLSNKGTDAIGERLAAGPYPDILVDVNLALSEVTPTEEAPEDYRYTCERVADGADYFVVNAPCPNSEGFRDLQSRVSFEAILEALVDAGVDPLLIKLSSDLPDPAVEDALEVVDDLGLDGVVASNMTTSRPDTLRNPNWTERGGLPGKLIKAKTTNMIRSIAEWTDIPVAGVGDVSDTESAYRKTRIGAEMVQLYTSAVYERLSIACDINCGLLGLPDCDGSDDAADAVGSGLQRRPQ